VPALHYNQVESLQFPVTRYERVLGRNSKERLAQYAGKRVRYIHLVVDLLNRKPVEILRVQYSHLSFDSEGLIDPAKLRKEVMLSIDILPPEPIIRYPWEAVEPKRSLPRNRHDDKSGWTPTPEMEAAILGAIFGTD
jgi:hypothetical protein